MSIRHHLDEATLISYTAGSLSNAMALVVACHLSMCKSCREKASQMESVGSALLTSLPHADMSMGALDKALCALDENPIAELGGDKASGIGLISEKKQSLRLSAEAGDIPEPLSSLIGVSFDHLEWRRLGPGISYVDLPIQGTGVSKVLKIEPGRAVLPHTHNGNELTLILRGSYTDEVGRFTVGDVADLDDEIDHQPLVDSQEPCICITATDSPLKFTTLLGRVVQPLTGF